MPQGMVNEFLFYARGFQLQDERTTAGPTQCSKFARLAAEAACRALLRILVQPLRQSKHTGAREPRLSPLQPTWSVTTV